MTVYVDTSVVLGILSREPNLVLTGHYELSVG
jgi:hypothetical protein